MTRKELYKNNYAQELIVGDRVVVVVDKARYDELLNYEWLVNKYDKDMIADIDEMEAKWR